MRLFHCSRAYFCAVGRFFMAMSIVAGSLLAAGWQPPAVRADEAPPELLRVLGTRGTGPGEFEYPGDMAIGPNGLLYVADENNYRIQVIDAAGNPLGSPWAGMFEYPDGIAVDINGTVHVCERGDYSPPRITAHDANDGTIVHSFGGWSEFSSPDDVAATSVDGTVYVYVADTYNNRIRKFSYDSTTGYSHVLSFDGSGSDAGSLSGPRGVTVGPDGTVWVADTNNGRIVRFTAGGDYLDHWGTRVPGYTTTIGEFYDPEGIAVDAAGDVYVSDTGHNRIHKLTADGVGICAWDTGDGSFNSPKGIAVDGCGIIYVVDSSNHRIQVFGYPDVPPAFLTKYGTEGTGNGQFAQPRDVAVTPDGCVYVTDTINDRIQRLAWNEAAGQYEHDETWGAGSGLGQFVSPRGIAADDQGNVYVADYGNARVQKYDGVAWSVIAGSGSSSSTPTDGNFYLVADVAVAPDGTLYVTDSGANRIQVFTFDPSEGEYTFDHKWGSAGAGDGQFNQPFGIAIDAYGYLYVSDTGHYRVQKFDAYGNYICQWGLEGSDDGQFNYPYGVAVDSEGYVYVVEDMGHRVQKFTGNGIYRTQWGTQGAADNEFNFPFGLAVGADDHVYVADTMNHRIQVFGSTETVEMDVALEAGWNMVSVPLTLDPEADAPGDVFPGNVAVYTWNPTSKSYEAPETIAPEVGYWVAMTTADTITVTGTPATEWTDALTTGWNMCGSVHGDPVDVDDLDDGGSGAVLKGAVYWWDPTGKSYSTASQIDQGKGYWIAATCACELTVAGTA
jgi:sugar lactone lactonase YvrE